MTLGTSGIASLDATPRHAQQACAVSAPRPTVSLQQAVNDLNEAVLHGDSEIAALEKLRAFLCAQINGPVPSTEQKHSEPRHLPLADLPGMLASQSVKRCKLMDEIALMLGAM